jgi:NADPH:quinone reductase-like Zn-dependent oxidoreductase
MRAYQIQDAFGLEHLQLVNLPTPKPGPGQVRVQLQAVSLNYRDLMMVKGQYNPRQPLPLVPCSDGAGVVKALGKGVTRFDVGDRVMTCFHQGWTGGEITPEVHGLTLGGPLDGTLVETLVVAEEGLVATPDFLTDVEAATLPCAGVTAYSALFTQGRVRPGDTVLVLGTGGVSCFALELARAAGCRVIVTSSSAMKLAMARELGATETVNYREFPEWHEEVRKLTGGRGVDLVVEVGGAGTLERSMKSVRTGGTIAVIGVLSGTRSEVDVIPVLMQRLRLEGVLVGSRDDFEALCRCLEGTRVHPVIDRVFSFKEAPAAFRYLEAAGHVGKVVIGLQ